MARILLVLALVTLLPPVRVAAQENPTTFAGVVFGVSTLSADGISTTMPAAARVSLYKPENGVAFNAFAGVHLSRYFSIQGNYIWNRNDLTLTSLVAARNGGVFYEQHRDSAQHSGVLDALLYFRSVENRVRPYLSTGLAVLHLSSSAGQALVEGLDPPTRTITATRIGLRVAVGIDLAWSRAFSFRYSFSETISRNPISAQLIPPGERRLANFQNLFGIVRHF
jgi:hypothetical protein